MAMTSVIPVVFVMMAIMMMMMAISLNDNVPSVHIAKRVKPSRIDNYTILVEDLYLKYVLPTSFH